MNYQKPAHILQYSSNRRKKVYPTNIESSDSETEVGSSNENLSREEKFVICNTLRQEPQGQENSRNSTEPSYSTLIIHGAAEERRRSSATPPHAYKHNSSVYSNPGSKEVYRTHEPGVCEITNIPDDYLSQSQVLKHLAKEVKVPYNIEKNKSIDSSSSGKHEWYVKDNTLNQSLRSKSQPDLTRIPRTKLETSLRHTLGNTRRDQRCAQMMENLIQENNSLKLELEACYQKVAKSQKLEQEVTKVHVAHEDLVKTCEKREKLERTARSKLQNEIRRLQETNRHLREQVDIVSKQLITARVSQSGSLDTTDISKRDALITQLVAQNKELMATKDRQEIELSAQHVTLEEQRTHIDILDTALTNAQANVVRLEEECRKKQMHVERVAQLQEALASLRLRSDRREEAERKLRFQLENELRIERARNSKSMQSQNDACIMGESLSELKRKLREKDEKIMQLEGDVAKWEQRYLEESQLRQAAIDAASIPKDAKIAALEKTSQESEKIIAEARSDKLRQMDEVHAAQKKVTDLESRMKELESKLAERDAMIRVLQKKHVFDKEVATNSYPSTSLSHHAGHSNLNMADLSTEDLGPVCTTSVLSAASSVLTSSTGFGSSASYGGSITGSIHPRSNKYSSSNQSFDEKSLDDQLKELDSQLLSKRGLCCFPGFSHPGAMSRKGKASQPLLAGVKGSNIPLFGHGTLLQGLISQSSNRPDDMILLEKQGLCSQAQRQDMIRGGSLPPGSLPPSSLPRPKRHHKSSVTAKFGGYGRLSDSEMSATKSSNCSIVDSVGAMSKLSRESTPKSEISAPKSSSHCSIVDSAGAMSKSSRETTPKKVGEYSQLGRRCESPVNKARESPSRSMFLKWGEYNKLKIAENERKLSTNSTSSTESVMKPRSSPIRSFIPAAKRVCEPDSYVETLKGRIYGILSLFTVVLNSRIGPLEFRTFQRVTLNEGFPKQRSHRHRQTILTESSKVMAVLFIGLVINLLVTSLLEVSLLEVPIVDKSTVN